MVPTMLQRSLSFFFVLILFFAGSFSLLGQKFQIVPTADTLYVCPGNAIQLSASGADRYFWSPPAIMDNPQAATVNASPTQTTLVTVRADVEGQTVFDTVVLVLATPLIDEIVTDASFPICRGETVTFQAVNNVGDQGFSWSPAESLDNDTTGTVLARPLETTTYTARVDINGCTDEAEIRVEVRNERVDLLPDSSFLCEGEQDTLSVSFNAGTAETIRWFPSEGLSDTTGLDVIAQPKVTTIYFVEQTTNNCVLLDSVIVRIDSLPDLSLQADPQKDIYCVGETVTLFSPTFETSNFPIIQQQWVSALGAETPDTLFNLVFVAQDSSAFYTRITRNGGCVDSSKIFIEVVPPKEITIEPVDPLICPGETVTLEASFEGEGEIMWEPQENISCIDCKTPTVNPLVTTAYTITVEDRGCPSSASRTVEVLPQPTIQLNGNPVICFGESIQLNLQADDQSIYEWTSPDDADFSSTDPQLVVNPPVTTTYVLTAQLGDCQPVQESITVVVVQDQTVAVSGDQTICPGDPVTLTAEGTAPTGVPETYQWTWNGNVANGPMLTVDDLETTTVFTLTYVYGPNCGVVTETVTVIVEDAPVITGFDFVPENAIQTGVALGDQVMVGVSTEPANPVGVTYNWTANGTPLEGNGPTITDEPTENPTVYMVTITSDNGCTVSATTPPIPVTEPVFEIPNAFTPDGDNVNDNFNVLFNGNIQVRTFQVFNRWGKIVYDNDDLTNGWDGTIEGEPAPSDVYVYRIQLIYPDGREFTRSGDVTLIR